MSDALSKALFDSGGVIAWAAFIIPGFIAWRFLQARRPQGEQKAADAIVTIATFAVVVAVVWFNRHWTRMPATWADAVLLLVQIFVTPLVLAFLVELATNFAVEKGWITSPYPRAWDFIFNEFAIKPEKYKHDGLFMIVTLKDGSKIAGVYAAPGHASLWPYDRDLFLGKLWQLDENDEQPMREVTGSIGIYIDESEVQSIEVLNYKSVLQAAIVTAESVESDNSGAEREEHGRE